MRTQVFRYCFIMLSIVALMGMTACPWGSSSGGNDVKPSAELQEIAERLDGILQLNYTNYSAENLFKAMYDDNAANDVFVVDVRDAAAYSAGHIPGAINIPMQDLPMALLNGTSGIPDDMNVVVASDYGNDGHFASVVINAARVLDPADTATYPYYSKSLAHGMNAWSYRSETRSRFDGDLNVRRVEEAGDLTPKTLVDQRAFPSIPAFAPSIDTTAKKILVRADAYINSFGNPDDVNTNGKELYDILNDSDDTNDPQIISVRSAADYATGHIPGAINIAYKDVAKLTEWTKYVDPNGPVVVYCYTGHTGGMSNAVLGILGYNTRNLLYGYNGWSATAKYSMQDFDASRNAWDFPMNPLTTDIDNFANFHVDYQQPDTCAGCHTSLTAIYVDIMNDNPPGAVEPPSSGEG